MNIKPINNIIYFKYQYNKKKDDHQKEFVEVAENLTKDKKCGIIEIDIKV